MRNAIILVAILTIMPLTSTTAQVRPPVEAGERVRVTAPSLGINLQPAIFEALSGDVLVVVADSTMNCPLRSVRRLEVQRGRKRSTVSGAVVGGTAGALVGLAIGLSSAAGSAAECESEGKLFCDAAVGVGLGFGLWGGALVGAGVGALIKTDRWEEVPLDQLRVSFAPLGDGRFALGLSVEF